MAGIVIKKTLDILSYESEIVPGSREEILFNLIKSYKNDHFGWKRDKDGFYREMFLRDGQLRYFRKYLKVSKVRGSDFPDLYLIRLKERL